VNDEYVVDFPTLDIAADWIQAHCVVPDGFKRGEPFVLVNWQLWALLNFYRLKPTAQPAQQGRLSAAFHNRRSQIVLPQKAGKAPYTAAHICLEGVGPSLFAGWAQGGEVWDCLDHGCGCGWIYEYEPGEAMGMPHPTPLIQITAYSEDQTDNIYRVLRPMIDDGPLTEVMPKTGEEFIRIGTRGRIDTVSSNAKSRLGQQVSFVAQDETGIWTKSNGMIELAHAQRRGLAGMGGRTEETTNAWNPAEESIAQLTAESKSTDIFRLHTQAPSGLSYRSKSERRKIHKIVYNGCPWVDLDAIEGEAAEIIERDPAQAERFFGNRAVAGTGHAFDPDRWDELVSDYRPDDAAFIVLGIDGARFEDALAVIATEIETGFQWPVGIWQRPENAPDNYEHPMGDVDGAIQECMDTYVVWRVKVDPGSGTGNIDSLMEKWQGRWDETVVMPFLMNRPKPTAEAIGTYTAAITTGEVSHDGDELFSQHIKNAVRQKINPTDDDGRALYVISKDRPHSPRKIDAAAAAVISWDARGDAIAEGAEPRGSSQVFIQGM